MKRLLIFLVFLFVSFFIAAQPLTLVSWNLKDLGKEKDSVEIRIMAEILRDADVVAIQEVVAGYGGAQAVARLAAALNTTGSAWDYTVSDPASSSSQKSERYAYLWKKHRVRLSGKPWLLRDGYDTLIEREPFLATFESEGETFTLVNVHAKTKSRQPETEVKYLDELPALYSGLNLIFAGDFNLPQSHSVFNPLKRAGYVPAIANQKTSLRQQCLNGDCLASELDNIFYHPAHLRKLESGVIHFYTMMESFEEARGVSDHLPVFISFMLLKN